MNNFRSYTRKSSAIVGARRAGLSEDEVFQMGGKWGFIDPWAQPETPATRPTAPVARTPLPRPNGSNVVSASSRGYVNLNDIAGTSAELYDDDDEEVKKQKRRDAADAKRAEKEAVINRRQTSSGKIGVTVAKNIERSNKYLLEIKRVITRIDKRAEDQAKGHKLQQLEVDRETRGSSGGAGSGMMSRFRDKAGDLFGLLKMLALPALIGAFIALEKKFNFVTKTVRVVGKVLGAFQDKLNDIANLPLFKNNILGMAIKNLLPILGAFGAFALWKPGAALNAIKGITKIFGFLSNSKELAGLSKFGRIAGKIFLPITIINGIWETISGAIAGWKSGGTKGMLKGALDGLVHGLIGGLIDTISTGIGWVIDQFGGNGSAFKNFKFGKFLDALGSNLGSFAFDVVDSIKRAVFEAIEGMTSIFNSDKSFIEKMMSMIAFPVTFIVRKFKETFGGLSFPEMLKKFVGFVTADNAVGRAAATASAPSFSGVRGGSSTRAVIIDPGNPASMQAQLPSRNLSSRAVPVSQSMSSRITGKRGSDEALIRRELEAAGITDPEAQAAVLGNFQAESGLQAKSENLNYRASRLYATFPKKFKNTADAASYTALGEEAVGNKIYGGRMGNAANEGYKFRGRGYVQLTGKDNYRKYSQMVFGDDRLVENPDLLLDPEVSAKVSVAYIKDRTKGDLRNVDNVTRGIAPANVNSKLAERRALAAKFRGTAKNSGQMLASSTEQAEEAKSAKQLALTMAPINASRTSINTQTTNHLPSLSASTPVEFAPHVV